jgi:flavorubredoxin
MDSSGEAPKFVNQELEAMKFQVIDAPLKIKYVPDAEGIEACQELARKIAKALPGE